MRSEIRERWQTTLDCDSLEHAPLHRTSKRNRTAFRNQGNFMKKMLNDFRTAT
jgi:hypothetical protein